jgi:formylmethanofuran dehydrogenase subunit B
LRNPAAIADAAGLERGLVSEFLSRLTKARYGALFFDPRAPGGVSVRREFEGIALLVRDLNEFTRFVLLGLGSAGNLTGAEAALTWQGGFPQGVDFGPGFPVEINDSATLDEILAAGETDAVLAIADPFPEGLSARALAQLGTISSVVIAPGASRRGVGSPAVALNSATCGIEVTGTVTRVDGVVIPLRPIRESRFRSDRDWLRAIARLAFDLR